MVIINFPISGQTADKMQYLAVVHHTHSVVNYKKDKRALCGVKTSSLCLDISQATALPTCPVCLAKLRGML